MILSKKFGTFSGKGGEVSARPSIGSDQHNSITSLLGRTSGSIGSDQHNPLKGNNSYFNSSRFSLLGRTSTTH